MKTRAAYDEGWLADYRRKRATEEQRREAEPPTREDGVTEHVRSPAARSTLPTSAPGTLLKHPVILLCQANGLEIPEKEHRFHPERGWKFDYSWPGKRLALEVEGGLFSAGRHAQGEGAMQDLEKYSEAAILGWRIIYTTPREVENGHCMDRIRRALAASNGGGL